MVAHPDAVRTAQRTRINHERGRIVGCDDPGALMPCSQRSAFEPSANAAVLSKALRMVYHPRRAGVVTPYGDAARMVSMYDAIQAALKRSPKKQTNNPQNLQSTI